MLRAENLTKRYGSITALDGVTFDIGETVTGLLGPNGAGKSTAIKLFLGLTEPTSGRAEVLGRDVARDEEMRARLGYMPEHDCLPSAVSAAEFLSHMAETSGLPPRHARVRAADTLRHVGLFEERYRPIGGYSTGMKQRVKLAQALVHDPVLVLLDEPTAGLDPPGREEMLALIRKTHREFGISLVMSSHLMGDVERTCERILVLESGRVLEEGETAAFTEASETLYIDVTDRRAELIAALAERNVTATEDGSALVVDHVSGEVYDRIRDALVAAEAPLRRLAPRRRTLTDIFQSDEAAPSEDTA
ncbi:MAG: ABC transporter ATP-binding protein, partial [Gaiellaceae bacterium]